MGVCYYWLYCVCIKFVPCFSGKEKEVYDFVVRHFLACCSKDAQGLETIVDIDIAGEKVKFYVMILLIQSKDDRK